MSEKNVKTTPKGLIGMMLSNRVAANMLMALLLIGGLIFASDIKREAKPDFSLDEISISVTYDGASPKEIEQSMILVVEDVLTNVDGIKETHGDMFYGRGELVLELEESANAHEVLQNVQTAIDSTTTFPEAADKPVVELEIRRRQAVSLVLSGAQSTQTLRKWSDELVDALLSSPAISQVDQEGIRDYEIQIEISQANLRLYDLTLSSVAQAIEQYAKDQGSGMIQSTSGDILLKVQERRDEAASFASIPVKVNPDGSVLTLGEVAHIVSGFEHVAQYAQFNDKEAILLEVYQTPSETPQAVSEATLRVIEDFKSTKPCPFRQ